MIDFQLHVLSFEDSTCEECYRDTPTTICTGSNIDRSGMNSPSIPPHSTTVTMTLRDILEVLFHSKMKQLAWIDDFVEDPIVVTRDLHDVLSAFQQFRRAS